MTQATQKPSDLMARKPNPPRVGRSSAPTAATHRACRAERTGFGDWSPVWRRPRMTAAERAKAQPLRS